MNNKKLDSIQKSVINLNFMRKKLSSIKILSRNQSNVINKSQLLSDNIFADEIKHKEIVYCLEKCKNCEAICKYRLSDLNSKALSMTHEQVKTELSIHKHP